MKSFCINLKQHNQKWINSQSQLFKWGFDVERIDAVYGKNLDFNDLYNNNRITLLSELLLQDPNKRCSHEQLNSKGAIGCFMSHIKCWQKIIDDKLDGACIFEDDLVINENEISKFKMIMNNLPPDTDVLSFGYLTTRNSCSNSYSNSLINISQLPLEGLFKRCDKFFGTQGYYVTNSGAKKLLAKAYPLELQVDGYIAIMGKLNYINLLFTDKSMINQHNITGSDIQFYTCIKCEISEMKYSYFILTTIVVLILLLM